MMYTSTRLHKHLPMYLHSRRLPMIMTSSITTAVAWLACLEWCWHFCTFLHNPHFDFEPDYVIRKPRKGRFQRYIVRTEIFSTFHTWVEYISVKTVIGQIDLPTPHAAMTPQSIYRLLLTDGQQASQYPAVHCVHLADIINTTTYSPKYTAVTNSIAETNLAVFHPVIHRRSVFSYLLLHRFQACLDIVPAEIDVCSIQPVVVDGDRVFLCTNITSHTFIHSFIFIY